MCYNKRPVKTNQDILPQMAFEVTTTEIFTKTFQSVEFQKLVSVHVRVNQTTTTAALYLFLYIYP